MGGSTRIIAGAARGMRLTVPRGRAVRPTSDRVREALFSILVVPGERVLDLFAGTGGLGLEALSRGAQHATFVEHDARAQHVLEENVARIGSAMGADTKILHMPVHSALRTLKGSSYDLVFADPPYASSELAAMLVDLCRYGLLSPGARVVCEHSSRSAPPPPPPCLQLQQTRSWGEVALTFFVREQP